MNAFDNSDKKSYTAVVKVTDYEFEVKLRKNTSNMLWQIFICHSRSLITNCRKYFRKTKWWGRGRPNSNKMRLTMITANKFNEKMTWYSIYKEVGRGEEDWNKVLITATMILNIYLLIIESLLSSILVVSFKKKIKICFCNRRWNQ